MTDQRVKAKVAATEAALAEVTAQLAAHDDARDEIVARQHELIQALARKKDDAGNLQFSLRQLGALGRMSHQNVALILGWVPPKDKPGP